MKFKKRVYDWRGFFSDLWFIIRNLKRIRGVTRNRLVSAAFRERLMLAVTSVYGCRYCSHLHTREAIKSGLDKEEIAGLLSGIIEDCPEEEAIALIYAQHWADSDANPDPEAVRRLQQTYGAKKADDVNFILRMNRFGNLTGNSWDYFLHRISFGRLGT